MRVLKDLMKDGILSVADQIDSLIIDGGTGIEKVILRFRCNEVGGKISFKYITKSFRHLP